MDNRVINHCKGGETYNPKTNRENNLGLDKNGLNVVWAGLPGMKISALVPLVQAMVNCVCLPHALVIHCGGKTLVWVPLGKY